VVVINLLVGNLVLEIPMKKKMKNVKLVYKPNVMRKKRVLKRNKNV
jgi:hypothetical protein